MFNNQNYNNGVFLSIRELILKIFFYKMLLNLIIFKLQTI